MGNRCDRREFIKIIPSAALATCVLGSADITGSGISSAFGQSRPPIVLASDSIPNVPVGVGRGLHPGRVIWAHDPRATKWQGPGQGHWWESENTNQAVVDNMMSAVIQRLGGKSSDGKAWNALIKYFNQTHGNGSVGYKKGEKVTIKVNLVGCITGWGVDPKSYDLVRDPDYMNASPQMILALLRQLVHAVGVQPRDIDGGRSALLVPQPVLRLPLPRVPQRPVSGP